MFINIDLMLKHTSTPLSVQRQSVDEAAKVYQQILEAIRDGSPKIIELTCERYPDKKLAIITSEICAVQMADRMSTTSASSGKPPGFAALAS